MTGATRRRGADLEAAIFAAALDQLGAAGYRRLTMEGVATAARTGKAALYRRWNSKDELLRDALLRELPPPVEPPATGTVRGDVRALLVAFRDTIASCHGAPWQALKEEDAGAVLIRELVKERLVEPIRRYLGEALRAGVERGEVRPRAATRELAELGPAMITYRYMTRREVTPDETIDYIVDEIVLRAVSPPP
ncbi:Bacterial regulatory protein, tetR family [Actinomadura rubteroloni]|uniref:Bacterial regulatory protein, tetR family n=1 Tax=Actinomadura rubteroloni TaxID=1926885 RepID=A0A2P4UED7_9ACTN|nr:TetR/AcrR family transcriptional regulator [Actinomadura rubteroloni]POM23378.1 Bacterial regulatory protein, tetR family [Actinomadura rubteroloni]